MAITPIKSSWMTGFEYDPKSRRLTIHTKGGDPIVHDDVPAEKVEALGGAASAGAYYNAKIRNVHPVLPT